MTPGAFFSVWTFQTPTEMKRIESVDLCRQVYVVHSFEEALTL